jgi:hypothetical protein
VRDALNAGHAGVNSAWAAEGAKEIIQIAYEASDFPTWAAAMSKRQHK